MAATGTGFWVWGRAIVRTAQELVTGRTTVSELLGIENRSEAP